MIEKYDEDKQKRRNSSETKQNELLDKELKEVLSQTQVIRNEVPVSLSSSSGLSVSCSKSVSSSSSSKSLESKKINFPSSSSNPGVPTPPSAQLRKRKLYGPKAFMSFSLNRIQVANTLTIIEEDQNDALVTKFQG